MQMRAFRKSIAGSNGAFPPLTEPGHGSVMHRHFGRQSPDPPAAAPAIEQKVRLFPGDQIVAITAHIFDGQSPDHDVTAKDAHLSRWYIPFDVA